MFLLAPFLVQSLIVWVPVISTIIDVSHHNGQIDWKKAKAAGVVAAIAKASEGNHFPDKTFVENWNGMKAAGIQQLGAYHYMRGAHSPKSQVKLFESCLKRVDFDANKHFIAIDVEGKYNENVSAEKMADTLKGIIDELKPKYSNIYIYAAPGFEHNINWKKYKDDFRACNLWISHYTTASQPRILEIWKDKGYKLWQYSETGTLKGLKGHFDMNKWKN